MRRVQSVPLPAGLPALVPAESDDANNLYPVFEIELEARPVARSSTELVQIPDGNHPELAPYNLDSVTTMSEDACCLTQLLRLCRATNETEAEIAMVVKSLLAAIGTQVEAGSQLVVLAEKLRSAGYEINVMQSCPHVKDAKKCLKNLRHTFLYCVSYQNISLYPPVVVDLKFRDQFLIANPTFDYDLLVKTLPEVFIGTYGKLKALVSVAAEECFKAFQAQGLPLPPWRTKKAILSKWNSAEALADRRASRRSTREHPLFSITNISVNAGQDDVVHSARQFSGVADQKPFRDTACSAIHIQVDSSTASQPTPAPFSPRNKVRSLLAMALCKTNVDQEACKVKHCRAEPWMKITTVQWGALRGQASKNSQLPTRADLQV